MDGAKYDDSFLSIFFKGLKLFRKGLNKIKCILIKNSGKREAKPSEPPAGYVCFSLSNVSLMSVIYRMIEAFLARVGLLESSPIQLICM